jgi:hypothetical protein
VGRGNSGQARRTSVAMSDVTWFQTSTYTAPDRYPKLFDDCRAHVDDGPSTRLLSFGCSTGEEVESLAARWPHAAIVGVDINPWCVTECRRRFPGGRFTFLHRVDAAFETLQPFDAVFCLAVLQRPGNWRRPDNEIIQGHTFEQFAREIAVLDARVKVGALLAIDNADFRFADTTTARRYVPLNSPHNRQLRRRPVYGPVNTKIADVYTSDRIFIKRH